MFDATELRNAYIDNNYILYETSKGAWIITFLNTSAFHKIRVTGFQKNIGSSYTTSSRVPSKCMVFANDANTVLKHKIRSNQSAEATRSSVHSSLLSNHPIQLSNPTNGYARHWRSTSNHLNLNSVQYSALSRTLSVVAPDHVSFLVSLCLWTLATVVFHVQIIQAHNMAVM